MATRRVRLAERRKAIGYTQEQLAEQLGVERTTIARWEAGSNEPQPWQRPNLAMALHVSVDELIALLNEAGIRSVVGLPAVQEHGAPLVEPPSQILERIQQQGTGHVTDTVLDALDAYIEDVVEHYEEKGPTALAPDVVRQRQWLQQSLVTCPPSKRGERLVGIAGRLSAMLAYMATNLGRFHSARAYAIEAFALADQIGDADLKSWVRGTQSFTEYYTGNYRQALDYALDGQRYAGSGQQAVRLVINGEARALAKMQQPIDCTVGRAYEILAALRPPLGMSSCISFGLYSEARVASNAATAYLSLRQTTRVLEHAAWAAGVADASPSIWSQALVRLDTASALAEGQHLDLERATNLCREAMTVSRHRQVESVRQRTREFVRRLRPWQDVPVAAELAEEVEAWLSDGVSTHG